MSSEISPSSNPATPTFGKGRKGVDGPAPKAQPEDTSDFVGEDGMPLNPGDQGVQFIPGHDPNNGDAKVEIGDNVGAPKFVGLGKEELMKFANDPFWVRLRWILFILFWLIWLAMLAGAVIIILYAPKCSDKLKGPTDGPYYQVYLKSFTPQGKLSELDSSRIDYLKGLGVKSVIISQILETDSSEGISRATNFKEVSGAHGNLQEFKNLVKRLHDAAIKVILQFIPNHSSTQHPWFKNATLNEKYYVRKDASTESKWMSQSGGSAWHSLPAAIADNVTYLHNFAQDEPDLNYNNADVVTYINGVLEHWYNAGADGFLLSDVSFLKENMDKLNEPGATLNNIGNADLIKSLLKNETWKREGNDARERPYALLDVTKLSTDSYSRYYDDHIAIVSTSLAELSTNFTGDDVQTAIETTLSKITKEPVFWRLGGPRLPRAVDKFGVERANALTLIAATLRGQFILYYGDEYLRSGASTKNATVDPLDISREKFKQPPVENEDFAFHKSVLKAAATFNQAEVGGGSAEYLPRDGDSPFVFAMKRVNDEHTIIVATNFGDASANVDITTFRNSQKATVLAATPNAGKPFTVNATISSNTIDLPGASGVILELIKED